MKVISVIFEARTVGRSAFKLSFVCVSIFFLLRLLFLVTYQSHEMLEQFFYSTLFESLYFNLFILKYSREDVSPRSLYYLPLFLSLMSLYFVSSHALAPSTHFSSLGPLSFQALICFFLLSSSLIFSSDRHFKSSILISQSLAILPFLLSLVSLLILLFEIDLHKSLEYLSGMNLTSTLFFLVLSLGCLSIDSDKELVGIISKNSELSRPLRKLFLFSLIVPSLMGWLKIHFGTTVDAADSDLTIFFSIFFVCFLITTYLWFTTLLLDRSHEENRSLQLRLLESEASLKLALHSSKQGIWGYDYLTNKIYLDPTSQQILQFTSSPPDLSLGSLLEKFSESDQRILKDLLHSEKATEIHLDLEVSPQKWARFRGSKIFDTEGDYERVSGTIQDISFEVESQAALKQSEETLRLALEAGGMGTFTWDIKNEKIHLSESSRKIYGFSNQRDGTFDLQFLQQLVHPEDLLLVRNSYQISFAEKREDYQFEYRIQVGKETRWVGYRGKTIFKDGAPSVMIGILFDETRLKTSVVELSEEKRMREKFISTLSHDLKNVLNVSLSYHEMARRHAKDLEKVQLYTLKSERSLRRGTSMIKDLLDLSFLQDRGVFPLKNSSLFKISEFINQLTDSFPSCRESLEFSFPDDFIVSWSEEDMKRVFENLIGNARKYGFEDETIEVRFSCVDGIVTALVHNQGKPIPPEIQEELFTYLERSDCRSSIEGWGIGLSIVKGIVEAHRGKVSIQSSVEEGTNFILRLPALATDT
jgi:signal transduction histidine kinase